MNTQRAGKGTYLSVSAAVAWLCIALLGFVLVCAGVAIDVYRHEHGADAGELISTSSPGALVALGGMALMALGLLAALSLLMFRSAGSVDATVRRGMALVAIWGAVVAVGAGAVTYAATAGITIGHDGHDASATTPDAAGTRTSQDGPPGAGGRVTLRGDLSLDGAPLEAQFLGARVMRDGLATACQATIPAVTGGSYEIAVLADAEVRGCGAPGAEIVLWTHDGDGFFFSTQTLPWPDSGAPVAFDATFLSNERAGATTPVTEFKGELRDRDGASLPAGTVVEAYAGDVRCGVTSLRHGNATDGLYTLIVADPDAVGGCAIGATLTFRIDGEAAAETAVNDLGSGAEGHELDLTVE